ncbi:MAG TPA: pectate lyase [Opitutaceae bacterium]|nr:pectate lyase [Opitutaceae bacterium]
MAAQLVRSLIAALLFGVAVQGLAKVRWSDCLKQPADWYASDEARGLAANVLLYQSPEGGWPKNRDMTLSPEAHRDSKEAPDPTIDNDATTTQLELLARVFSAGGGDSALKEALVRGLDYLFASQYENGGWPQFFPLRKGYYSHITFNDDAMVNVLQMLREVARAREPYAWVDPGRRARAARAVEKGIECILRCQIEVDGVKTAWCAQHDEVTFAPAPARKFEPVSLSGWESVGIVEFLMGEESPAPEVVAAVHAAVAWFERAQLHGIREDHPPNPSLRHKHDRVVVADPSAPPIWARFYEIGTDRPIYTGRDAVVRYDLAEVEPERRGGYRWHLDEPLDLIEKKYPKWAKKWPARDPGASDFSLESAEEKVRKTHPEISRPSAELPRGVLATENLTYATVDGAILQLDVYRPEGAGPWPVVLILHGGGWETGSRHMERTFAKQLAARGYATVPVSYSLGSRGGFTQVIADLKAAITWLRANASAHALDTQHLGVIGGSAGGQLAAWLGAANIGPLRIEAVVDIDGLADFTGEALVEQQAAMPSAPVRFIGKNFADDPEAWRRASAITHVSPRSAPTLFLNSSVTSPILPGREEMRDKLRATGVDSEIVVFPDTPHPFWLFNPWFERVVDESDRWMRRHLSAPIRQSSNTAAAAATGIEMIVAADGSGQFTSIQAAISAAPMLTGKSDPRTVIRVKPGVYKERVYVQRERGNIAVIGEDAATTVIEFGMHANMPGPDGLPIGTFRTPTVQIDGDGMIWENITFANTAGAPGPRAEGPDVSQALALRVDGDCVVFRNCRFLGWQDTILVNRGRHYFADCYIEGHVDFIFGAATALFERCHIHCLSDGYITAVSTPEGAAHGFVFTDCKITGEEGARTYLGRPWREFAKTVFIRTEMSDVVRAEGWHNWNKPGAEKTTFYREFGSKGPGSALAARAKWTKLLGSGDAARFTPRIVLGGADGWDPAPAPTVHFAGDSTMADKGDSGYPERGWGELFRAHVAPGWRFVNHAANGRSTLSFRTEGRWANLLAQLKPGDAVVIQFGHNDQKDSAPTRYADPVKAFPENLRGLIDDARSRGASVVLATPVVRREWADDGTLTNSHGSYVAAVRAVAESQEVPLLDLERLTREIVTNAGRERSKEFFVIFGPGLFPEFPAGKTDNTHFNETGARLVAQAAATELSRLGAPFVSQ